MVSRELFILINLAQKQQQFSSGPSTSVPSLPITFIKQDSDSYAIKQVAHPQQTLYSSPLLKQEPASDNRIMNNINNFKNLQKNLELIEQQHVGFGPQRFVVDESDEEQSGSGLLTMFDCDDDDDITLSPLEWDCNDVIEFLKRSNCSQHCELFMKNKIDGKKLLQLTQTEIIQLLGMKVGPAIKVFDLIQQIKVKVAPCMHTGMK
jgi:hypothetical protein